MPEERDIAGERIVVTGATSGIGREIARALARRGAHLTLFARDPDRARAAVEDLAAQPGAAGRPEVVLGDLAHLASIREAARHLHARHEAIDVLVSNAGMRSFRPGTTADGFEQMMGTNHLGPFLLTHELRRLLGAAPAPRIVITASEAHRLSGSPDLDRLAEPEDYGLRGAERAYGQSKLMNILFTQELARRLGPDAKVTVNCFCPGAVATGLVRETRLLDLGGRALSLTPFLRRPEQGARMGVRLVVDPELAGVTGRFFTSTPGLRFLGPVAVRSDEDYQRRAFDRSAELVGM